jgi:hypothetical protein
MKLTFLKSVGGVLLPSDDECIEAMNKIKNGTEIMIEYKQKRNVKFHRKAFALLNLVLKNQDKYSNINDLLVEFKLKSGHYEEHITTKGKIIYVPKSIAFSEMDELEFNELYSKFIDIALQQFISMSKEELEQQIINFI